MGPGAITEAVVKMNGKVSIGVRSDLRNGLIRQLLLQNSSQMSGISPSHNKQL